MKSMLVAFGLGLWLSACGSRGAPPSSPAYAAQGDTLVVNRKGPITFETAPARRGPPLPAPPVTARVVAVVVRDRYQRQGRA